MGNTKPEEVEPLPRLQRITRDQLIELEVKLRTAADSLLEIHAKMKREKRDFIMAKGIAGIERERGALDILRGFVKSCRDNFSEF